MVLNERQKQLLEITEKKRRVTVGYLAKRLYVSEMTVRRDLKKMDQEGFVKRYHGGAIACVEYTEYPIEMRMHMYEREKRDIAAEASKYIHDGQIIFFNSSSTCAYILPCLKEHKDITVVTNSVQFLLMLSKFGIRCLLTGGEYDERNRCLLGREAEDFLRGINPDIAFLACSGIADDGVITESEAPFAAITRIAFRNATQKILLADRSKLGTRYAYNIGTMDDMDHIIIV